MQLLEPPLVAASSHPATRHVQPTTGLDPETRRSVWRLVNRAKAGRCTILTTHSMDVRRRLRALCLLLSIALNP